MKVKSNIESHKQYFQLYENMLIFEAVPLRTTLSLLGMQPFSFLVWRG